MGKSPQETQAFVAWFDQSQPDAARQVRWTVGAELNAPVARALPVAEALARAFVDSPTVRQNERKELSLPLGDSGSVRVSTTEFRRNDTRITVELVKANGNQEVYQFVLSSNELIPAHHPGMNYGGGGAEHLRDRAPWRPMGFEVYQRPMTLDEMYDYLKRMDRPKEPVTSFPKVRILPP